MGGISWLVRGGLALVFTLANTAGMTPVWLIKAILSKRSSSQSPNALQTFLTYACRAFLWWLAFFRAQPAPTTRTPGALRNYVLGRHQFTWIEPAAKTFDTSKLPCSLDSKELTRRTAGLWFLNPRGQSTKLTVMEKKKTRVEPVLLYFHGGAYITLEAGDIFMGTTLGRMQAKYAGIDTLSINYRLAPGSKYPSQLFEAYSAYRHLRDLGYAQILLGGDSAGANLALTLWRYLDEIAKDAQPIRGLVLHSPWLDMRGEERVEFKNALSTCSITKRYVTTGFRLLQQANGLPRAEDGWVSPIRWTSSTLQRLPPIIVTNGGAEALMEEANIFIGKARAAKGRVEHVVFPDHPHDFIAMFWFASSSRRLFSVVGNWIGGVTKPYEA